MNLLARVAFAVILFGSTSITLIGGMPAQATGTLDIFQPEAAAMSGRVVPLTEGFEGRLGRFTSFSVGCAETHCLWGAVNSDSHSGTYAAYAADVAEVGDDNLIKIDALAIPANATSASLTFWHRFNFEYSGQSGYDGGVLEVSVDDGVTWTDAGPNITAGGYTGAIDPNFGNPLAGRAGWVYSTGTDWEQVVVNLLPYRGPSLLFRLRLGTDISTGTNQQGWWVDDVQVSYEAPLPSCGQAWSTVSTYPATVQLPATVALDGLVYSFGGDIATATASAYTYEPGSDTWTPIASLPTARFAASAVTDGTYIYILGGVDNSNTPTASLWRYDPASNSYTTLMPLITATAGAGAVYLDGAIYRIAGTTDWNNEINTATVEVYTIATNSWAPAPNYPEAVSGLAALSLNGYIYTAGGNTFLGDSAKTYRYDPNSTLWDDGPIADLPGPSSRMAAALYRGNWVLAGNFGVSALSWNPQANAWRSLDQMPQRVIGAGGGVADGAFYTVGGFDVSVTNTVQRYIETDCATNSCPGDCNGDDKVTINEIITGVGIALGSAPVGDCSASDKNGDGVVGVNELISAVNAALNGCSP